MILLKDAKYILTMDKNFNLIRGSILVEGNKIKKIGFFDINPYLDRQDIKVIDVSGKIVMPGFVQPHIHLCQTLFRGYADDLQLLQWLKYKIWPLEASHNYDSLKSSAFLGIYELIDSGTTTILTMETVNHTEAVFEAIKDSGIRAISGKCMMDKGDNVLTEDTKKSIEESVRLLEKWHNADSGRIKYAFAPRFVPSCTEDLLKEVIRLANYYKVLIHTHASENRQEIELVKAQTGYDNIEYFYKIGLTSPNLVFAHGIWLKDKEFEILRDTQSSVIHCPSSNLKLSSGIADVKKFLDMGIKVGLASDGAPCSNNLDQFLQMRLAGYLQSIKHSADALRARDIVYIATKGSAKTLGLDELIGSLEEGKLADIIVVNPQEVNSFPYKADIYSSLVYSMNKDQVETVIINGKILKENGKMLYLDKDAIMKEADIQLTSLLKRASKNGYVS